MNVYKHFVLVAVVTAMFKKKNKQKIERNSLLDSLFFQFFFRCAETEKKVVISFKCF